MKIRYDTYEKYKNEKKLNDTPCVIYRAVKNSHNLTDSANWHEDLEIQLFASGEGYILISGENYPARKNDIVLINSGQIHYTGTDSDIIYYSVIIDSEFCKRAGIDISSLTFEALIISKKITELLKNIIDIYFSDDTLFKKAQLQAMVLNILIELTMHHLISLKDCLDTEITFHQVKIAVKYIREHYSERLTLDIISKNSNIDKFTLSKKFKILTGQTIVEYINSYRCERIKELIFSGVPIGAAAIQCGFNNISFFTKTFKKYTGMLPSEYKRKQHKINDR